MDSRAKLIEALQIKRDAEHLAPRSRWTLWMGVLGAIVIGAGIAAYWMLSKPSEPQVANAATDDTQARTRVPPQSSSLLDASGYVVARRKATISATINGRVMEVLISEGTQVRQGEIVARLEEGPYRLALAQARAQLNAARARLHAAEVAYANAEPTYQRVQQQRAAGYVSAQALDDAKAAHDTALSSLEIERSSVALAAAQVAIAERNLTDTVVHAPFTGVITDRIAQPGEVISPAAAGGFVRTGIGTLVDMDSLEVEVEVSENFIHRISPKQPATVRLNAYPEWEIPAEVIAVIPTADRAKATMKVRVGLKVRDSRILPDMGVRVAFMAAARIARGKEHGEVSLSTQ